MICWATCVGALQLDNLRFIHFISKGLRDFIRNRRSIRLIIRLNIQMENISRLECHNDAEKIKVLLYLFIKFT